MLYSWKFWTMCVVFVLGCVTVFHSSGTANETTEPSNSSYMKGDDSFISSLACSSVRLRVATDGSSDVGTGTVIHTTQTSQYQEALILTCGHLFRPTNGKGTVEVDFFDPNSGKPTTVQGVCVYFDAETDIGFVGAPLPFAVRPITLVPPGYEPKSGDQTVSVGCSHGDIPTVLEHRVLSTDQKFFNPEASQSDKSPFYYIEVNNAPVQGRSGGGLYTPSGDNGFYLLGVCNAGDPETNNGFFLPASVIYETLMANKNLAVVYEDQIRQKTARHLNSVPNELAQSQQAPLPSSNAAQQIPVNTIGLTPPSPIGDGSEIRSVNFENNPRLSQNISQPMNQQPTGSENTWPANSASPSSLGTNDANEQLLMAGFDELRRRQMEGAEIICIVNWPSNETNPQNKRESEVIRLPKK